MEEQYMSLITDYIDGTLTEEREREFRQYVEEGHIVMEEVEALKLMDGRMAEAEMPEPSPQLKDNFYQMLAEAKQGEQQAGISFWQQLSQLFFSTNYGRMAFAAAIMLLGIWAGTQFGSRSSQGEMEALAKEVYDLKELTMMAMLEKESVADRLKGVQMSQSIPVTNQKVTDALFMTLNNDESTNVRMAALSALSSYTSDPIIREGLIKSIAQQESPLMQVALAELMVELQESKSVEEFNKLLESERTPEEVKSTLKESIEKIM